MLRLRTAAFTMSRWTEAAGNAGGAAELAAYLEHSKAAFHQTVAANGAANSNPKTIHVVMGNESCDLDSVVSAIVYARMLGAPLHGTALGAPVVSIFLSTFIRAFSIRTRFSFFLYVDHHHHHHAYPHGDVHGNLLGKPAVPKRPQLS